MQGRGRGQLSFHKAQPVTAASTIASVTYDDPNGSWESWEPGASWNGTGGGGHSDAPSGNAQPGSTTPPASKNDAGMRWDEDGDTNLRHPGKQLPGTLITMSELDWEDTEELATELWRHPMRPRISRDPHVRAEGAAQRLPARSPVRPDPRHLPMPLPGPGGARPHARSEEPTARLRMSASAGLTRTGAHPRVQRGGPPQTLPKAPPPRPEVVEPEQRRRTTTQPGAATAEQPAAFETSGTRSTAMPEDWLNESSATPYSQTEQYAERMPAEAFMPLQPSAAGAAHSGFAPMASASAPQPSATGAAHSGFAPMASASAPQPSAAGAPRSGFAPMASAYAPQPTAAGGAFAPQRPAAAPSQPMAEPFAPQLTSAGGSAPQAPAAERHAPHPSAASGYAAQPHRYAQPQPPASSRAALMPPPPAGALAPERASGYAPPTSQFQPRGSLIQTQIQAPAGGPPAQLPPAPPPRPSLPAEPLTHTQSFEVQPPAAPAIESLRERERTLTPPRLLPPPPPRFPSSAHIPTIIGTPAASAAPPARGPQQTLLGGARLQPRAAGRDFSSGTLPPSHAQSQLIEQLQEQLLEAMARARVQEARAAEAEKSVEQAEEQLAAVARIHSEESEQLQQQVIQLSQQLQAAEQRASGAELRARQPDNILHLAEPELMPDLGRGGAKQGRANLILSGLLASSLSFGGAAYFMFYAPLQKQLGAVEQLRTQDAQAHATAVTNLQARSTAEKQGLEAQNADLRKQLDALRAEAAAAASSAEDGRRGRGRRGSSADAESPDGTPAGTRSARAIERRMRRSHAAESDEDEAPRSKAKARGGRDDGNDPLGGI